MKCTNILSVVIVSLITISNSASAQSPATDSGISRNARYTVFTSVGRSTFASDPACPEKFPTLELRLGAGVIKPIGKTFKLRSRLTFGVKFKREAYNKPGQAYLVGPPFMALDELASNRNYAFIEIPLTIQYNLPHPKFGLSLGMNYRSFFPNNSSVDAFANRREVGIISGVTYPLSHRLHIGLDYYFGLTKIYSSAGKIDNQDFAMDAWNRFAQIRFDYILQRKN